MKALAVPDTAPRSAGPAVAKIAAKNAGVLKVTPSAVTAVPTTMPSGVLHVAATVRPAAIVARAAAPRRSGGSRSGTFANTTRQTTTTPP